MTYKNEKDCDFMCEMTKPRKKKVLTPFGVKERKRLPIATGLIIAIVLLAFSKLSKKKGTKLEYR